MDPNKHRSARHPLLRPIVTALIQMGTFAALAAAWSTACPLGVFSTTWIALIQVFLSSMLFTLAASWLIVPYVPRLVRAQHCFNAWNYPVYRLKPENAFAGLFPLASALGFSRRGMILIKGDWPDPIDPIHAAYLAHETAHLQGSHNGWKLAGLVILLNAVPTDLRSTWCGIFSFLLGMGIVMTISRICEMLADRHACLLVPRQWLIDAVHHLPEAPLWPICEWLPGVSLLLTHPSKATRLSLLAWYERLNTTSQQVSIHPASGP